MTLSIGGSAAHRLTVNRQSESFVDVVNGEAIQTQEEVNGEDFTDVSGSLFLSLGYFVADRLETGLSSTTMTTWYSGVDRDDFSVYDAQVYAKYFFDRGRSITPFVKLAAGWSRIDTGSYEENNANFTAVGGLEFFSVGPLSWFAELSSKYTNLGGDLSGAEWQNQLYFGMTWYFDFAKARQRRAAADVAPAALAPEVREQDEQAEKRWGRLLERIDGRIESGLREGGER